MMNQEIHFNKLSVSEALDFFIKKKDPNET